MAMDVEKTNGAEPEDLKKMSDEELDAVAGGNWDEARTVLRNFGIKCDGYSNTQMHEAIAKVEKDFASVGIEAHLNGTKKGVLWGYNKNDSAATFVYRDSAGDGHVITMETAMQMYWGYQGVRKTVRS